MAQIAGSTVSYFHKDHLGSSTVMTNSSGTVIETTNYEPFGGTRAHTGITTSGYKFTDQELDAENGLYNYDARLYDPIIGRFITPDTIVPDWYDPQSLNRYSYARNNPLIYVDPTGHLTVYIWDYTGTGPNDAWGHASMDLENGTHISWWPNKDQIVSYNPIINNIYEAHAFEKQTLDKDISFEGKQPDHQIVINGLDEAAIQKWWDSFRTTETWKTLSQNCSTTVADALKAGGAKVNWTNLLEMFNLIWTPADVLDFANAIDDYQTDLTLTQVAPQTQTQTSYGFTGENVYIPPNCDVYVDGRPINGGPL